ncbi:MAG: replication family protein [Cressdnaviricota sp.]|nr:MAG: replication family protein [Cressdnaviricota sp.]
MQLHEIGHVQLRHDWSNMKGDSFRRMQSSSHPFAKLTQSGLPAYETTPCRSRGCWACQYKARRKLRNKVQRFVDDVVLKAKRSWRFVTLTLPGEWYEVRSNTVAEQLHTVRRAFASWRLKMQRRGRRLHGFYTIEFEGSEKENWHTHVHMLMKWKHADYNELKKLWTESVDRKMRKQLENWTEGTMTNDQRVVQVDKITSQGIADYCTKVTNYVTKGPKSVLNKAEIGKLLYRKRTTGWLGEYHGNKKETGSGS